MRPFKKGMMVICSILSIILLPLILLMILKATPLLAKENEARMKLHKPFSFHSIKLYITRATQASAYHRRCQQIAVCTNIGEKLSQHSGSAEVFLHSLGSKLQASLEGYSCTIHQIQNEYLGTSSQNLEII